MITVVEEEIKRSLKLCCSLEDVYEAEVCFRATIRTLHRADLITRAEKYVLFELVEQLCDERRDSLCGCGAYMPNVWAVEIASQLDDIMNDHSMSLVDRCALAWYAVGRASASHTDKHDNIWAAKYLKTLCEHECSTMLP